MAGTKVGAFKRHLHKLQSTARHLFRHPGICMKPHHIACLKEESAQIISRYGGTFMALSTLSFNDANDSIWPKAWILKI
jgi:hypothetical protein